jgi:hypothetical protein
MENKNQEKFLEVKAAVDGLFNTLKNLKITTEAAEPAVDMETMLKHCYRIALDATFTFKKCLEESSGLENKIREKFLEVKAAVDGLFNTLKHLRFAIEALPPDVGPTAGPKTNLDSYLCYASDSILPFKKCLESDEFSILMDADALTFDWEGNHVDCLKENIFNFIVKKMAQLALQKKCDPGNGAKIEKQQIHLFNRVVNFLFSNMKLSPSMRKIFKTTNRFDAMCLTNDNNVVACLLEFVQEESLLPYWVLLSNELLELWYKDFDKNESLGTQLVGLFLQSLLYTDPIQPQHVQGFIKILTETRSQRKGIIRDILKYFLKNDF